jgi:hypothetical protein
MNQLEHTLVVQKNIASTEQLRGATHLNHDSGVLVGEGVGP